MRQLPGVYMAVVMGGGDPANQGRIQVSVPAIGVGATWAPVCNGGRGSVGGKAVVAFEGGDPARPIVLGFLS